MKIRIEFFGIPRQRIGLAAVELPFPDAPVTLGGTLVELGRRFPEFEAACLDHDRLKGQFIANLGGRRFVKDPQMVLTDGETLLVMSADAGG